MKNRAKPYFEGLNRDWKTVRLGDQGENQCRGRNGYFTPRTIEALPMSHVHATSIDIYSSQRGDTAPIVLYLSNPNAFALMKLLAHSIIELHEQGDDALNSDELLLAQGVVDFPIFHGGVGEGPEFDPDEYASEHIEKRRNEHRWMIHDTIFTASRTNDGVELNVKGYGTADMPDDQGAVLALDYHAGKLQAIAHPDINSDDITVVPLVDAAVIKRVVENFRVYAQESDGQVVFRGDALSLDKAKEVAAPAIEAGYDVLICDNNGPVASWVATHTERDGTGEWVDGNPLGL